MSILGDVGSQWGIIWPFWWYDTYKYPRETKNACMFVDSWNSMDWHWKRWFLVVRNGRICPKFECLGPCKGSNEKILTFFLQTHVKLPKRYKKVGSINAYSQKLDFHGKKILKSRFRPNKQKVSCFYWLARRVLTRNLQGNPKFLGAGGGRHTFGPWRKIDVLANSDVKKIAIPKILVCVKHPWSWS